jgi:hypothetical protein
MYLFQKENRIFDRDDRVGIHNLDKLGGQGAHIRIIAVLS